MNIANFSIPAFALPITPRSSRLASRRPEWRRAGPGKADGRLGPSAANSPRDASSKYLSARALIASLFRDFADPLSPLLGHAVLRASRGEPSGVEAEK